MKQQDRFGDRAIRARLDNEDAVFTGKNIKVMGAMRCVLHPGSTRQRDGVKLHQPRPQQEGIDNVDRTPEEEIL